MDSIRPNLEIPAIARVWSVLRSDLAPFPGRMESVWRFILSTALVIVISMALQVPYLSLSIIMVVLTAQENAVLTKSVGLGMIFIILLGVVLSILMLKFTIDYPMLRILGAAIVVFFCIYFMRISKVGAIGYGVAMMLIFSQTWIDTYSDPEYLTRAFMWVWIAVAYPIGITIVVNFLFLPARPERMLEEEICRQLDGVNQQLEARRMQGIAPHISLRAVEQGVLVLKRHLSFAMAGVRYYRHNKGLHLMRITTVDRLHTAAAQLSRLPAEAPTREHAELLGRLQAACKDLKEVTSNRKSFTLPTDLVGDHLASGQVGHALQEMAHALNALAEAESLPSDEEATQKEGLLSADWLTNPVYAQFALKTVLAAMLTYVFYTAVQWPGIHTATLTCIILALPSLGASTHKGWLRILGCALGSLVTLMVTVFAIPHLDSITGLLLVTLPVIGLGAWIAAGSARTNYIGVQFVIAYALALLGRFGPTTDIPEIRDRMVGILIGVGVSMLIYSLIWPEREGGELKKLLGRLLRSIANFARTGGIPNGEVENVRELDKIRADCWTLLAANREMEARVAFEPSSRYDHDSVTVEMQTWCAQAQEALFAVNWFQTLLHHHEPGLPDPLYSALESFKEGAANRLEQLADQFDELPFQAKDSLPATIAAFDGFCNAARGGELYHHRIDEISSAMHAVYERITQLSDHFPMAEQRSAVQP